MARLVANHIELTDRQGDLKKQKERNAARLKNVIQDKGSPGAGRRRDGHTERGVKPTSPGAQQIRDTDAHQFTRDDRVRRMADRLTERLRKRGVRGIRSADMRQAVGATMHAAANQVVRQEIKRNTKKRKRTLRLRHKAAELIQEYLPAFDQGHGGRDE